MISQKFWDYESSVSSLCQITKSDSVSVIHMVTNCLHIYFFFCDSQFFFVDVPMSTNTSLSKLFLHKTTEHVNLLLVSVDCNSCRKMLVKEKINLYGLCISADQYLCWFRRKKAGQKKKKPKNFICTKNLDWIKLVGNFPPLDHFQKKLPSKSFWGIFW